MIKRLFIILMVVFIFMPSIVYADVVYGNEFLSKNQDKTEKIGESYKKFYVNNPSGYVVPKEAPGSDKDCEFGGHYENGEIVYIDRVYLHRGKYWGIPPISHAWSGSGWFQMDDLLMLYDNNDFEAEHQDKLYDYTGGFDKLLETKEFYIWQWPGSDREKISYEVYDYMEFDANAIQARHAYRDDENREWVYITLWGGDTLGGLAYAGAAEGWVCLSDPNNGQIPAFNPAPEPIKWSPGGTSGIALPSSEPSPDTSENTINIQLIIIVLVVLIAGAAILIWVFWKHSKIKTGEKNDD